MIVDVHKANGVGEIESMTITASVSVPTLRPVFVKEHPNILQADAAAIVEALYRSLPQGTLERVFALMAQRQASSLIVRVQ